MKKQIYISLLAVLLFIVATGCNNKQSTSESTAKATLSVTSDITAGTTSAATAELATPTPLPKLTEDQLGRPFESDLDGVELLFSNNYENDNELEEILQQGENIIIYEGKLSFDFDKEGSYVDSWAGWTIDIMCTPEDAQQYELSFDLQSFKSEGKSPWDAFIMGSFLTDSGGMPYYSGMEADGFLVTLTNEANVNVYFGGQWPSPILTINIPEGFDTVKRVYIVTNESGVYYWMDTSAGEKVLMVCALFTEDDTITTIYNGAGESLWTGKNVISREFGYFRAFNHFVQTQIDNVTLKAYAP